MPPGTSLLMPPGRGIEKRSIRWRLYGANGGFAFHSAVNASSNALRAAVASRSDRIK